MPVSGSDDKTVIIARQSSNCSAGVPIKKRKVPLIKTTSSPPPEQSPLHAENDTPKKELCKPTQDSSLSDASIVTNSPGISDASKSYFPKEMKGSPADTNFNPVQSIVNFSRVKHEEPSLSIFSGSVDNMDNKKKLISENINLQFAPNEGLALNNGKGITINQKVERACKLELSSGNTELSLELKEPLIPSLAGQNCEQRFQIPDKVDSSSFSLFLGEGKPIIDNKMDDDRARLPANRSNWDLNTTMDAWEGSVGDATTAADQGALSFDVLSNAIDGSHDVHPSTIPSTGIFGVSADLAQPITGAAEQRSYLPMLSLGASKQYKPDDSLHLQLCTPSLPTNFSGETSGISAKVASSSIEPSSNSLKGLLPGSPNSVGCRPVKLESHDENAKHYLAEARGDPTRSLDLRTVKREVVEKHSLEVLKMSTASPHKLVEQVPVKSEPVQENQETQRKAKETSCQSDGRIAQGEKNCSSSLVMPLNPQKPCPSGLPTCSTELSMSGDTSKLPENADCSTKEVSINTVTPHERCNNFDQVASETVVTSVDHQSRGSNASDGIAETVGAKDLIVKDFGTSGQTVMPGQKVANDHPTDAHGNVEGTVSDEEKFNISTDMLEEDSYSSESDGNHALAAPGVGRGRQFREDDEEYEDGELREQLLHNSAERPIVEKREAEDDNLGDSDMDIGSPCDGIAMESGVNEEVRKLEDRCETSDEHIKECVGAVINEKAKQGLDKDGSMKMDQMKDCDGSLTVDLAGTGSEGKSYINNDARKLLDQVGGNDVQKGHEMELSAGANTTGSQGSVTTGGQAAHDNSKGTETLEKADSTLPKIDSSLNVDAASKDANTGGNRSRIITLPRATNVSPCKTRSFQGRSFPSRSGRERFFDFDVENPRGNRDEIYNDGPRKYNRDRFQEQSFRSRPNFMRGRGRASGRSDAQRGNWDSDRDFPSENYNGPSDYRFSRHKRAPPDGELDCRGFIGAAPNGAFIGSGRGGGRKPMNDEFPSFRHPLSRRHSPGGRDGPATRGNQMVRRMPRNISPSRHMGEDRSDLVGLRRGDKFMRGLPDDNSMDNPVFTRPQHSFDGVDNQFVRGNRNFSSAQRRGGLPRIRSKSPIRSGTRSPGPWSSPRRRSPDGFNGLPELIHGRSPANNYRRERMRSPPYISRPGNDLRDMDSGRDHGHLRSAMPNRRSPPDQVLPRGPRRLDIQDPRERTDGDEYFGRFHELGGDGNGDERRKSGEGRGPVRNFRPPYNNGADADNFRFHVEDGPPRPFRFCPEADPEFLERNDLREREFDGRIKGRPFNASRRTRTMEEQEGNYRHGGEEWRDDGYDDVSRGKRRRF
ncbi:hypothetical protein Vadar_019180 [Vaccinium darrowii]|uniref:Uncharacterized protein n=1 Tax=Vaccinium darrowii TaxID=229202 RepID=A0ACB7XIH4_9ERIC|nr:hypothetical protein Vadar_019180 [Vaccinium darrowii]